VNIGINPEKR